MVLGRQQLVEGNGIIKRIITVLALTLSLGLIAGGCANPCKDLEAKKAVCPKEFKTLCEVPIDMVVKMDDKDACKKMLDTITEKLASPK